ncbi:hypothetical protein [Botrimarina hoheduenensis]|uniref:Uncharacterized protein n=1 Tax=Botrimarina hoheduenensis TaxID=2528000 RepID=A0A5C5VQ12_9BACT|nr:hypothetical protein [Botrimarina hoheduenensis]TWT40237.1 hypothetical protein Pla111_33690 [Botrimarina hoheduenensis]
MTDPTLDEPPELWLDRGGRRYAPGEILTGRYRLGGWREAGLQHLELAVLWYTTGQGEEDLAVHDFLRRREATLPRRADESPDMFSTTLPGSPWSYDGQLLKVCWAVRLRGFFAGGKQRVVEEPFWLGPSAEEGTRS